MPTNFAAKSIEEFITVGTYQKLLYTHTTTINNENNEATAISTKNVDWKEYEQQYEQQYEQNPSKIKFESKDCWIPQNYIENSMFY